MNMNKLPDEYENPCDRVLLVLSSKLLPVLHETGHFPNVITTYSFLAGICFLYCLWNDRLAAFTVLFQLSYFFDCMDGQMARHYNQTSQFGDLYDHTSDVLCWMVFIGIIWVKYRTVLGPAMILFFCRIHHSLDDTRGLPTKVFHREQGGGKS